jgi:tetratricopeptide (TPR) repeat protein
MMRVLLAGLAVLACLSTAAFADEAADAKRYAACMERARSAPAQGLALAEAWIKEEETVPARHCRAVALIGLGREEQAVEALNALGGDIEPHQPALAADLYHQAGMVEFEAGRPDSASALLDRALKLTPDSVELLIDRALVFGAQKNLPSALGTLEHAHTVAPTRADVLVLIGSAQRQLGHGKRAEESIDAALALDPQNVAALLERGILRRLAGDNEGARADWERIRQLAPDSPEAASAAANLTLLDQQGASGAPAQ